MKLTFELDKFTTEEVMKTLDKAIDLPRRQVTKIVKDAMKLPLNRAKYILRNAQHSYTMTFKDGNTWSKEDIIKNLYTKAEKSYSKDKKVFRLGIKDWRVDLYSNFPEYGYTNPRTKKQYPATHFMRNSLMETEKQVSEQIIGELTGALEKLGLIE